MESRPTVFDLFCGCGGLSLGLEQVGMKIQWANDCWADAVQTFRESHPKTVVFDDNAEKLFARLHARDSELPRRGDVDLLAGGPPCQGFSGYNRHRSPEDPRNSLVEVFLDFVDFLKPRFVLMENVPGMLSIDNGMVARSVLGIFNDLGYQADLRVLQAGYYGLPQNRWRVFVLAALKGYCIPSFPLPTHEFYRTTVFGAKSFPSAVMKYPSVGDLFWQPEPMVTVRDAISDLPPIVNGGGTEKCLHIENPQSDYQGSLRNGEKNIYDHICNHHGSKMYERICAVPKRPGAGWLDLPDHLKPKNLVRHGDKRYDNRFGRLHWEGTFNTILTRAYPYWSRVIHPDQDRVLSVLCFK